MAAFRKAGIDAYAPYDFERQATLPDGTRVTVAFSLAFATSPAMPDIAFFTCHNKTPEYFWKPAFQQHANGARRIAAVYLVAEDPERHGDFLGELTGGPAERDRRRSALPLRHGRAAGPAPVAARSRLRRDRISISSDGPQFAGFAVETAGPAQTVTPAARCLRRLHRMAAAP